MSADASATVTPRHEDDGWGDDVEVHEVERVPLQLKIAPDGDVDGAEVFRHVMIRINVPEGQNVASADQSPELHRTRSGKVERSAMDVCCVVDISGSMRNKATYEVDGLQKDDGLTYLDIVKHAVKAVIGLLKGQDRFTLIAFDHHAYIAFALDYMTDEGRTTAIEALDTLSPRGKTDIWAGLFAGMEALRVPAADSALRTGQRVVICRDSHFKGKVAVVLDPNFKDDTIQVQMVEDREIRSYFKNELVPEDLGWRQRTILLLTDGQVPDYHQPIPKLRNYMESHPDFHFQLNTFGFGYDINSQMLLDFAVAGQGTFAFIPDAVLVGTCFVNTICNSLSTYTQNATLHLTPAGGAEFLESVLGVPQDLVVDASWGRVVHLGPLQFGQSRDVVVPMKIPSGEAPYLQATLAYRGEDGQQCQDESVGVERHGDTDAKMASCRSLTVDAGYRVVHVCRDTHPMDASHVMETASQVMEELKNTLSTCFPEDAAAPSFRVDVDGRMMKAIDGKDRFHRRGQHYLLALMRAHQLQVCTNFMDVGLQDYGGLLFRGLRDEGDAIFRALPAPKASSLPAPSAPAAAPSAPAAAPSPPPRPPSPDMDRYYAGGGGG